jgi:hypothetical protein
MIYSDGKNIYEMEDYIDVQEFLLLEEMLNQINIPFTTKTSSRRGFPRHRKATFGLVRQRFTGKYELSRFSKKYPEIHDELFRLGKDEFDFEFTSVHINKDVVCPPHKDDNNVGDSLIVSLGNYEGCKLIIEGEEHDTKYNPVIFNGAEKEHWNTDDLVGTKYSLVYFTTKQNIN